MIICGFPGVGKTTAAKERDDVIDVESSDYHYDPTDHLISLSWPRNYINKLADLNRTYPDKYILASCHKEVRKELDKRGVDYIIVVPDIFIRWWYKLLYIKRKNSASFINNVMRNWDKWIWEIDHQHKHAVVHLGVGEFMTDLLNGSLYNKYL